MNELESDLTQRRYHLSCKTRFYTKTVEDVLPGGVTKRYERTLVLLIPQESDERSRFLSAWLPETTQDYYEVSSFISSPVDSPSRLSIHRADERCEKHYLVVMSKGVEDILVRLREGTTINIQVLKASEDSEADFAPDTEYNFEVVQ